MNDGESPKAFTCRSWFDQPELVGARWWHQGQRLAGTPAARTRSLAKLAVAAGIVGGLGLLAAGVFSSTSERPSGEAFGVGRPLSLVRKGADDTTVTRAALEAQRADGWNVGSPEATLDYPDACDVDATGAAVAAGSVQGLATDLAPVRAALAPWCVSTLFQSCELPANANLRAGLRAIFSPEMGAAFGRGDAVRSLFEGVGSPADVAIVVDLPGPDAVAFAAALAPRFDPVFVFDNWPHPRGVVPAHLTLGAAVYYRPWFVQHRPQGEVPPVFVLDRNRLAPYVDDAGRFDNRYLAKLPGADALAALGVTHVLYVVPGGADRELGDLNDAFVALHGAGLDIKILSLSDLEEPAPTAASRPGAPTVHSYQYGGYPHTHWWFWHHYGWYAAPASRAAEEPLSVSRGFEFVPTARPTLFSSGGTAGVLTAGRMQPRGFGIVTFHTPGGSSPSSSGRSGSLGRTVTSTGG